MKISVIVKPNSKKEGVVPAGEGSYTVRVAAPPVEGRANARMTELLAEYFGVPKSRISIVRGTSGRRKTVEIAT